MQRTRTHETPEKVGERITVAGWVHTRRDHGKITFFDLRDRWGLLQVVIAGELAESVKHIRPEFVVTITGTVAKRPEKLVNPNIVSGTVELQAESIEVLNEAVTPPFELDKDTSPVDEELRLEYRYLDLRSERMTRNLLLRHRVVSFLRSYLNEQEFVEIETPCLTKGTPEGAREFIVPSRLHEGAFYVLPQSPQQYKQLLMISGVDRYYQIARAFRDEDQRGDRQPEHTQLDLEMSFVGQDEVLNLVESLMTSLVREEFPEKTLTSTPWPRLTYAEAMEKYGTDKPDLRRDKNDPNEIAFAYVVDFPLFEKDSEGNLTAAHHPFCMPHPDDLHLLESDPLQVRAWSYDFVCNGFELASGSVRIHDQALQRKVFNLLGIPEDEIERRFGHFLKAFQFGAPPHAGMAPGIDRLCMILAGEPNIREVMAFPKTGDAREPLTGAPTPLSEKSLRDVHIGLREAKQG